MLSIWIMLWFYYQRLPSKIVMNFHANTVPQEKSYLFLEPVIVTAVFFLLMMLQRSDITNYDFRGNKIVVDKNRNEWIVSAILFLVVYVVLLIQWILIKSNL